MQKVLFIESGGYLLKGMEQALETAGLAVFLASGIGNGLKIAREIQPDIVVVAVSNETGSLSFLPLLKKGGSCRCLAVLYSKPDEEIRADIDMQANVDVLLRYPVSSDELHSEVMDAWMESHFAREGGVSDSAQATVLEETQDFVILADEHLRRVFYVNEAAHSALGIQIWKSWDDPEISKGKEYQRELKDIYCSQVFDDMLNSIRESLGQGRAWRGETQLIGVDDIDIPVSQQMHIHNDAGSESCFVSLVVRDITDLKRTQETLETQESFYRLITENTSDLIALFDKECENIYSSPSYKRLLGFGSWELEGQGLYDCIHHDDRERVRSIVSSTIKDGREVVLQYRMMNKAGGILHFEATTGGIRNETGEFERLIFVSRDISVQVRQSEERKLMQLHNLHAQKMESIGQLAAGVAHEMNTPIQYFGDNLRFIRDSFSDLFSLLKDYRNYFIQHGGTGLDSKSLQKLDLAWESADAEFLFEEIPKSIDQSIQGVSNLSQIVGAMKEFSHPGTNSKIPIDFNVVVENTLTIARNEWKYIADIELDLDPRLPQVSCLPDEIRQVLLNLIINACHAIEGKGLAPEEKGCIQISTRLDENAAQSMVELRISDSGCGIPEGVRARIFEPFFTTKPVGKGTGQGLAIVHNVVVDKHSGQLHVESEQNVGTTFIVHLPVYLQNNKESK